MKEFDFNSKEFKVVKTTEVNGREAFVIQRKLRIEDIFSLDKRIGNEYIDGRELHEVLGMEERYSRWIGRMLKYGFDEGTDFNTYQTVQVQIEGNKEVKRTVDNHKLTLDMAKEIAMIQRSEIGKQVRNYFKQIEKDYIEYITGRKEFTEENRQASLEKVTVIQEGIVGTFSVGMVNWQLDIDKIMKRLGGTELGSSKTKWQRTWNHAYRLLEEQTGVNIQERLEELQQDMLDNGFDEKKVKEVNKISVVAKDIELIRVFSKIVQEMAAQKKIEVTLT